MVQLVKNLPAMQETHVRSLGREDPLEKEMETHSSILAWKIYGERSMAATVHGVAKSWTLLERLSTGNSEETERKCWNQEYKLLFFQVRAVCYCLVTKSVPTLCNPMNCSPPGSAVHGISQARILEWVAILFSRGSSQPRDWTCISRIGRRFFTTEPPGEPKNCLDSRFLKGFHPFRHRTLCHLRLSICLFAVLMLGTGVFCRRKWQPTPVFLPGEPTDSP